MDTMSYVLITPVRNEVGLIRKTIDCVVGQTILPTEWVIVSDGSTDGTDEIIKDASNFYPWIRLITMPPRSNSSFAAVVQNTALGINSLASSDYSFIGLLDSDVTFQKNYFEQMLNQFTQIPTLGLAGGVVIDVGRPRGRLPRNQKDVPGAVQFFRRECFERIGSLLPIPEGGWDGLACVQARMAGYETKLVTELVVDHHKPRNISQGGILRRNYQMGLRDYAMGYHPLFELGKCFARFFEPPLALAASAWWFGYCVAYVTRRKRIVPRSVLAFLRREQKIRMHKLICFYK